MSDRVFLDTNVLVYVFDGDAREKQTAAAAILAEAGRSGLHVVSTQVLQEFYVTVTRKLARPLAHADAQKAVAALTALPVAQVDSASVLAAIARAGSRKISLWDALILQSALESGCTTLLSEDLQHGQTIDGVRIENPFRTR
jgi:predicted nucleic acid-binding protein